METIQEKKPSHSAPRYVIARVKKILAAQGWPIARKTGRYSPFGSTVHISEGYRVTRVGVGRSVTIHYEATHYHGRSHDLPRGVRREKDQAAWDLLRSLGYRIDDKGWIECDNYDLG